MEIINIRLGFSSNSSSYHSSIIPDGITVEEILPSFLSRIDDNQLVVKDGELKFGWEQFILKEKDTIDLYLFAQVYTALDRQEEFIRKSYLRELFPDIWDNEFFNNYSYGVDHQSAWTLPKDFNSKSELPSREFIKELQEYLHDQNVVIVGGHDNGYDEEEEQEPVYVKSNELRECGKAAIVELIKDLDKNLYCYKDGNVWILFNNKTGYKLRFSFKNGISYEKSNKPELVDVIISNNCTHNCDFCYRGCNLNGRNANLIHITTVLDSLVDIGVPEIIIGGGDILRYPYLEELCDLVTSYRRNSHSVFNTTLNLTKKEITGSIRNRLSLILNTFDAVALSYNRQPYFEDIVNYCKVNGKTTISVQMIPELWNMEYHVEDVVKIQRTHGVHVVLLGFKETGRASKLDKWQRETIEKTRKNTSWLKELIKERRGVIGADTQFFANFPEMTRLCDDRTFTLYEGKFSCCIDVTKCSISPSSYSDHHVPFMEKGVFDEKKLIEAYQSF